MAQRPCPPFGPLPEPLAPRIYLAQSLQRVLWGRRGNFTFLDRTLPQAQSYHRDEVTEQDDPAPARKLRRLRAICVSWCLQGAKGTQGVGRAAAAS